MKKQFRRAFIEVTNNCNLACGFCARSARPKAFMPAPLFERAASQTGELAEVVSLHVLGEPLTHPDFPAILAACSRLALKVNLVTNGLLLDKFPPDLFREPCLRQVSVSLHALSCLPRGRRSAALARLAAFAAQKPEKLIVGFRLRAPGRDAFFDEIRRGLLGAFGKNAGPGQEFVKLGENVFLNFGGIFEWPGDKGKAGGNAKAGCLGLRHHFGILCDGRVVPCCADFDGKLAFGNMNENSLADILSSPAALTLKNSVAGKTPMPSYCASCGFSAPDS